MIGGWEWIILIVVVVFLLGGAKKIPDLARSLGRAMGEFQKGKKEIEREIRAEERAAKDPSERQRLENAARELGIDPAGKSDAELKKAIADVASK